VKVASVRSDDGPAISVHVTIYNSMKYLRQCLESILAQTFEDFEIVCVDDGSSDGSAEYIEDLAKSDQRIKLIRHDRNMGVGCARNTALLNSSGVYIICVDSDDLAKPDMLERSWAASNFGYFDIVSFGFVAFYEDGGVHSIFSPEENAQELNIENRSNLGKVMFWNKLIRRSLFLDNGIRFPDRLIYDDLSSMMRLRNVATRVKEISDVLYCYRYERKGSLINSVNGKSITDYADVYKLLMDWFKDRNEGHIPEDIFTHLDYDMQFISGKILNSTMGADEIREHLKQLLLMKIAFLENWQQISDLHPDDLLEALRTGRRLRAA